MSRDTDDVWTASANEAFEVSLISAAPPRKPVVRFNPKFTYPIFGDDEQIFGYQDLKIKFKFLADSMQPHVAITSRRKFQSVDSDSEPLDIKETLKGFLPPIAFSSLSEFYDAGNRAQCPWTPPGMLLSSFETSDATWEVWKGNLVDSAIKQLIDRIQILVLLLIEGASYITTDDLDADRWSVYFLYQKRSLANPQKPDECAYTFAGYCTVYRFYFFDRHPPHIPAPSHLSPGSTVPSDVPSRSRISQFLIIPPMQGKGNGGRLYETVYKDLLSDQQTREITVEDPNEAFDDLRDVCDLKHLRRIPEFDNLTINLSTALTKKQDPVRGIIDATRVEALRLRNKIAPRQFARVLEMHLMSRLPPNVRPSMHTHVDDARPLPHADAQFRLWRLLVKQRIYRQNHDVISQLDLPERLDKLSETLEAVQYEYACILEAYKRRVGHDDSLLAAAREGKRKAEEESDIMSPERKRARTEEAAA